MAGEALGTRATIATHTPIVYQDWTIEPGADVTIPLGDDHAAYVFVFGGAVKIGDDEQVAKDGELALLGDGDAVRLRGTSERARLLLLAGVPLGEPVARYGPFVMNTELEIREAIADFRSGKMGEITRTARHRLRA